MIEWKETGDVVDINLKFLFGVHMLSMSVFAACFRRCESKAIAGDYAHREAGVGKRGSASQCISCTLRDESC